MRELADTRLINRISSEKRRYMMKDEQHLRDL